MGGPRTRRRAQQRRESALWSALSKKRSWEHHGGSLNPYEMAFLPLCRGTGCSTWLSMHSSCAPFCAVMTYVSSAKVRTAAACPCPISVSVTCSAWKKTTSLQAVCHCPTHCGVTLMEPPRQRIPRVRRRVLALVPLSTHHCAVASWRSQRVWTDCQHGVLNFLRSRCHSLLLAMTSTNNWSKCSLSRTHATISLSCQITGTGSCTCT